MIMLLSSGIVGGTNLVYNLIIARSLGAVEFGHATAIYTSLMLMSSVTLAFQLVCSKLIARSPNLAAKVGVYRALHRRSWQVALLIGGLIISASPALTHYLHLPRQTYVVLLGIGVAIYIPLGTRRGLMQGVYDFRHLALNSLLEVLVKLVGAVLLLRSGLGVTGVIAAVVASLGLAYLAARPSPVLNVTAEKGLPISFHEGMQAIVFFVGQAAINNLDIVLVKHFFPAAVAGLYAAVALVGRAVYILCWSVVSSMFPVSAGSAQERGRHTVLSTALLLVLVVASSFTLAVWLTPNTLWSALLGAGFVGQAQVSFSSLLALYAALTGIYSLSVVLMTYEMSRRIANTGWLQLAFSAAIAFGIYLFHSSLYQVIGIQLALMVVLLVTVSMPFLLLKKLVNYDDAIAYEPLIRVRRADEEEVIAEFLKAEFYQPEFDPYRKRFSPLVYRPDLSNERDNAVRRELLFRRRGRMWRELPRDTQWWEVQLRDTDLARIRVFPRKHWRGLADGSFYLTDMVERVRSKVQTEKDTPFAAKMQSVAEDLRNHAVPDAVLLIGIDETNPLTIIEGNHRVTAAMLASPDTVHSRFRFYCGLSPRMTDCCWYQTDLATLLRYARNTARYMFRDRDYFIEKAVGQVTADVEAGAP
jgi:O-antigen/teichoic acid export membrane protein